MERKWQREIKGGREKSACMCVCGCGADDGGGNE